MIYLDASALVKLAVAEDETATLRDWLAGHADLVRVTTDLARVEVPRAVMRTEPASLLQANQVVARTKKVALTSRVLSTAASLQPPALRSLDAVHLASALQLPDDLVAFVVYDQRLFAAAKDAGLPAIVPA